MASFCTFAEEEYNKEFPGEQVDLSASEVEDFISIYYDEYYRIEKEKHGGVTHKYELNESKMPVKSDIVSVLVGDKRYPKYYGHVTNITQNHMVDVTICESETGRAVDIIQCAPSFVSSLPLSEATALSKFHPEQVFDEKPKKAVIGVMRESTGFSASDVERLASELKKVNKAIDYRNPLISDLIKGTILESDTWGSVKERELDVDSINRGKKLFGPKDESQETKRNLRLMEYKKFSTERDETKE